MLDPGSRSARAPGRCSPRYSGCIGTVRAGPEVGYRHRSMADQGLLQRLRTVFRAKATRAVERMESPDLLLDDAYERQITLQRSMRESLAGVVTSKKQLEAEAQRLEGSLVKLADQARVALTGGREDLARLALERKAVAQRQLQELDTQVAALEAEQERLIAAERTMGEKIEAFRTRKEVMKAQARSAEAQAQAAEAVSGIGGEAAEIGQAIERVERRIDEQRSRAAAIGELVDSGVVADRIGGPTDLDREIEALRATSGVDAELARLRAELSAGDEPDALPPGPPTP
jgi:phage shock protein A